MEPSNVVYLTIRADCEATSGSVNNRRLGERSVAGLVDVAVKKNVKLTLYVLPGDIEQSTAVYRSALEQGHEVGLHVHPADQGYEEFLGIYGPETQERILSEAKDRFAQRMGFAPRAICIGYASANDYTFGVCDRLGFTHGTASVPTRALPECASVWVGAPLDLHYANEWNRLLPGNLDFVEMPNTVDPESRMWGGKHPQDLRVELVDAKNHWYTINKSFERQSARADLKVRRIHISTHNIFAFDDGNDFRRITLEKMIDSMFQIAEKSSSKVIAETEGAVAEEFRRMYPEKPQSALDLDTRGRS